MKQQITTKKFASNVIFSITAQLISLLVGFLLNLIVPKFIDEYQYAYWQTYLLYVGYVGVLHFGLLDGLVLRYSQYDYDEIDKERVRSQFKALLIFTGFLSVAFSVFALSFLTDVTKLTVILVGVGITTKNLFTYSSYTFQITNRIHKYAFLVITQRVVYGIIVAALLFFGVNDFYWYCIADLAGDVIGSLAGSRFNKGMYFGKSISLKKTVSEVKDNVSAGIILMLANWSAILIISFAKMVINWRFDELVFGKVSFAFSLSTLFLTFITAVSVVLFPSLKRLNKEELPKLYKNIRAMLSPVLLGVLLAYFPGCWILKLWLPKYEGSLVYLGILLPLIVYSSKVNLLTNNYLKTYRKEKAMLFVNAVCALVGMIVCLLCAYVFHNLTAVLICIVSTVFLNSVLSELVVLKVIGEKMVKEFFIEGALVITFILAVRLCTLWVAGLIYLGAFAVYCAINYKSIVITLKSILQRKKL